MDTGGGSKAVVTARTRIAWVKFRENMVLLHDKKLSIITKVRIYRSDVRPAMWYKNEISYVREDKLSVLRKTERPTIKAMCGVIAKSLWICLAWKKL